MLNPKVFKWFFGALLLVCVGVVFSLMSGPNMPVPVRVISVTPLEDGVAVYEVLYDPGGATVPFVYQYFLLRQQENSEAVLEEVKLSEPFLVTASSGVVRDFSEGNLNLKVKGAVYKFKSAAQYSSHGETKSIRFVLDSY